MSGPIAATQVRHRQQHSETTRTPFGKPVQPRLQQTSSASLHDLLDGPPDTITDRFSSFSFLAGALRNVSQKLLCAKVEFLNLGARLAGIERKCFFENEALKDDRIHVVEEEVRDKVPDHLAVGMSRPTMGERM